MTYSKPEVLVLGQAIDAVQANSKGAGQIDVPETRSTGAYEADE